MSDLEKAWQELQLAAIQFTRSMDRSKTSKQEQFLSDVMLRGAARKFAEESEIANEEDES